MSGYSKSMYSFLKERQGASRGKAMYFVGRYITYPKLFAEISRAANALKACGIKKGDCITVALPNIPDAVYLLYGAAKTGVTVNLVHPLVPFCDIKKYNAECGGKAVFLFDLIAATYGERLCELAPAKVVIAGAQDSISAFERFFYNAAKFRVGRALKKTVKYREFLSCGSIDAQEELLDGSESAVIMHSSGTEGDPKSALLGHLALNAESDAIIKAISGDNLTGRHSMLAVLPMFHAFGLGCGIHCALTQGHVSVLVPKYSAKLIVKYINRGVVDMLSGVPTMYKGISECKKFDSPKTAKLITAFCGGDVLDGKLKAKFDQIVQKHGGKCRLYEGYGITEGGGVFSANKTGAFKDGSVGLPLADNFRAEAFSQGKMLPRGETGELCLMTPAVMKGYLDGSSGGIFSYENAKWIRTGDLGYVDDDGYLYFVSRIKRVVKVSGVNVFPSHVEKIIAELPFVKSCAVKDIPHGKKGHVLVSYIVTDVDSALAEKEILSACNAKLDKWSCPKRIVFVDEIPLTRMGKTDYSKLC